MVSWLVRSTPEQVVRVRALAGDIVLCSWVPANFMLGDPGGVEILPIASCYRNRDKLRFDGSLGSYADFTYLTHSLKTIMIHCLFRGQQYGCRDVT